MATLYVSVPLLAYCLGSPFTVEAGATQLLAILAFGAVGALGLVWAESAGGGRTLNFMGEAAFFLGCTASALYPVLSKWGLAQGFLSENAALQPRGWKRTDRCAGPRL
jgi:hypothetical protein